MFERSEQANMAAATFFTNILIQDAKSQWQKLKDQIDQERKWLEENYEV